MKHSKQYSLKVWLTTIILSPLLMTIALALTQKSDDVVAQSLVLFLASVVYGIVISVLPFLLLRFITGKLIDKQVSINHIKVLLFIITETIIVLHGLWLFGGNIGSPPVYLITSYSVVLSLAIWCYKLEPVKELEEVPFNE